MLKSGDIITIKYRYYDKNTPDFITSPYEIISRRKLNLIKHIIKNYNKEEHEHLIFQKYSYVVKGIGKHFNKQWDSSCPLYKAIGGFNNSNPDDDIYNFGYLYESYYRHRLQPQLIEIVSIKRYTKKLEIMPMKIKEKNPTYGLGWYKCFIKMKDDIIHPYVQAKNKHQAKSIAWKYYTKNESIDIEINIPHKRTPVSIILDNTKEPVIPYKKKSKKKRKNNKRIKIRLHAHSLSLTSSRVYTLKHMTVYIKNTGNNKIFKIPRYKVKKYIGPKHTWEKHFIAIPKSQWKKQQSFDRIERKKQAKKNVADQMKLYQGGRVLKRVTDGKRNMKITYDSMQYIPIKVESYKRTVLNNEPVFEPYYKGMKIEKEMFNIVTNQPIKRILWASNKTAVYIDDLKYIRTGWDTIKKIVYVPDTVKYKTIFHNIVNINRTVELSRSNTKKIAMSMNTIKGRPGYGEIIIKQIEKQKLKRRKIDKIINKIRGLVL